MLVTTDGFSRAGRGQSYRSGSSSRSSSSSRSYSGGSGRSSSSSSYKSSSSGSRTYVPYGSSHSSSGSTSSTASTPGENDWVYGLIALVIIFGGIGIAIYAVVKLIKKVLGIGSAKKPDDDDTAPTQYNFKPELAERLRADDPEFSPEQFMEKAKTIAERLQQSWSDGDMMPIRNYVSQGIFNRFRLQLELMIQDEGVRNLMADYRVMKVSALALSASKSFQTLHVSIRASARDVTVPAGAADEEKQKALADAPKEVLYRGLLLYQEAGRENQHQQGLAEG